MIVFDSSTLILLAKTELLDLFLNSFKGRVLISKKVEEECCKKKSFDALLIKKRIEGKRIIVKKIRNHKLCIKIASDFDLCDGEAEAIALALQENAEILGTDDRNAINACRLLKIPFTSAIGILVRAKEKKLIGHEESLLKLNELKVYGRYSKQIIDDAKKKLEVN